MPRHDLKALYEILGYRFARPDRLREALTHPSVDRRHRDVQDYDRMEFLGDRVLGLVIATTLFNRDKTASAGELAVRYNALVRKETVADVAREIELGSYLSLSPSEEQVGGRDKTAILGNAMEAVLGALFLDGGFECVEAFIEARWNQRIARASKTEKDAKTQLQESVQREQAAPPTYRIVEQTGPAHERHFTVEVEIESGNKAVGKGRSKRAAEQVAAAALLSLLKEDA